MKLFLKEGSFFQLAGSGPEQNVSCSGYGECILGNPFTESPMMKDLRFLKVFVSYLILVLLAIAVLDFFLDAKDQGHHDARVSRMK